MMAARKYMANKGNIITFEDYKIPEHDFIEDYKEDEFWYKGFAMLPCKNAIMNNRSICDTVCEGLTVYHNLLHYGFDIGRLTVPNIVRYNEEKQCYYGFSRMRLEVKRVGYMYLRCVNGVTDEITEGCAITKYDEDGNLVSIRKVMLDENNKVMETSSCSKSLYEFAEETIRMYNERKFDKVA